MSAIGDILRSTFLKNPNQSFSKAVAPGVFNFLNPSATPPMKAKEYQLAYKGWVYACVNAIAERMADIDLRLQFKKGDDWIDVPSHPALELLHYVNPFMSFTELMFSEGAYQELDGNAYWYIPKNGSGGPAEIWTLNPAQVTIVKSKTEFIAGYVYKNEQGTEIPLEPEEVIPFKRFNPRDPYRGIGTVQAAATAIDIDQYASDWQRNFFGNSALPSGLLYSENTMSQEQYDRIRANWDSRFKGVANSHKLGIMEGGMKYQQLTPSSRDMQFTEGRKDVRDEILAIFRVPKTILGITEDVNLASAQATEYIFAKYVIKPKMKAFVETLNEYYIQLFKLDPAKYRFNFIDPVPENNEEKRIDRESNISHGVITINEARAEMGLDALTGGDTLYIPSAMQPITGSNIGESEEDPALEDGEEKGVKKNFKKLLINKATKLKDEKYKKEQIEILHKTFLDLNKKLQKIAISSIKNQKSVKPNTLTKRLLTQINKDNRANEVINYIVDNEEYGGWMKLVFNASKSGLTRILGDSGKQTFAELKLESEFDLQNPRALDWLNEHALEDSDSYEKSWIDDMALQVQTGVEQGASNEKIADMINDLFEQRSDYAAMRIARTETINAYAQGNLEGYRQSGIVSGKYWVLDGGACPICVDNADAGTIGLDENFPSGDDAPAAHPNCECDLGGATDEDA